MGATEVAHPYHTKASKQQQGHALHSVVGVAQTMVNGGNNCAPRVTRTLRFLLNVGFFFFMPALMLSQEQKLASAPTYTTPLATGLRLDPAGEFVDLSSMPLGMALAPDGKKLVVVLSGWREQGIQVVDLATRRVTQTLPQEAAFYGAAFSADGKELYVSGGNEDLIYCYSWRDGVAALDKQIVLGQKKKTKQDHDTRRALRPRSGGIFFTLWRMSATALPWWTHLWGRSCSDFLPTIILTQ